MPQDQPHDPSIPRASPDDSFETKVTDESRAKTAAALKETAAKAAKDAEKKKDEGAGGKP